MSHISAIVIGAGQAGLAMSRCLAERSVPHVVLERGEIANSWKTERWNSSGCSPPTGRAVSPVAATRAPIPTVS